MAAARGREYKECPGNSPVSSHSSQDQSMLRTIALGAALLALSSAASALSAYELSEFKGYTIVYAGKVTGFYDRNHRDKADSGNFEGCEYDRKIFLDDRYEVTCRSYGYSYGYRPDAVILSNGYSKKLIVGDDAYDIR